MYRPHRRFWPIALLGLGAVLATGLVAQGPAQAAAAAVPALDHSRGCPAGYRQLTPVAERVTALGTYDYDYVVDGIHQTQHVIPAGFKPSSATDAQLRSIGLPARPSRAAGAASLARWDQFASTFGGTTRAGLCAQPVRKAPRLAAGSSAGSVAPAITGPGYYNWAGVVGTAAPFSEVYGRWTQNYVGNCSCTPPYHEVTWVGLGGDGLKPLIQDGTDMQGGTPQAWYEYLKVCGSVLCGVNEQFQGFIPAGHVVEAYTTADNPYADFEVRDVTTGIVQLSVSMNLGSAYFDSSTAEWINERPYYTRTDGSTYYEPLANFGQTDWQEAVDFRGGSPYNFSASYPKYVSMIDAPGSFTIACGGTVMAYPLNITAGTFSTKWCKAS